MRCTLVALRTYWHARRHSIFRACRPGAMLGPWGFSYSSSSSSSSSADFPTGDTTPTAGGRPELAEFSSSLLWSCSSPDGCDRGEHPENVHGSGSDSIPSTNGRSERKAVVCCVIAPSASAASRISFRTVIKYRSVAYALLKPYSRASLLRAYSRCTGQRIERIVLERLRSPTPRT